MKRRTFLTLSATLPAMGALSRWPFVTAAAAAQEHAAFNPRPGRWQTHEIVTRVEILQARGTTRVWLPLPVVRSDFQRPLGDTWSGNAKIFEPIVDSAAGLGMLYAEFSDDGPTPVVELVSRIETQDRAVDWSQTHAHAESAAALQAWLAPSDLMPVNGIVRATAVRITRGATTDVDKVKAVYDWILTNTYRDPAVRGCGSGDIRAMLEDKKLGGKCGDINGLFVGLVRAAGVPARDLYGIRVAPSAFGYKTLGAGGPDITKAQHCRAEVYLEQHGWVAMDPADVGKVAREETGEWVKIDHPVVAHVRPKLFGGWEGNWIAFNIAHDVALPHATKPDKLAFFMYPQAETGDGRRDCLNADTFKYSITARAV